MTAMRYTGDAPVRPAAPAPRRTKTQEKSPFDVKKRLRSACIMTAVFGLLVMLIPAAALAAPEQVQQTNFITLALYLGGLSLLPFAVMTLTSFLRIVVVLSFLRSGLGAQNVPPNIVIIALSLFLSMFVMAPTLKQINEKVVVPYNKHHDMAKALEAAQEPLKSFMVKQLHVNSKAELKTFYKLARDKQKMPVCQSLEPKSPNGCLASEEAYKKDPSVLPIQVIIPAFIISELKKAFIMGFAVLLPFLVIDMVISNILLSLGMFMLPPVVISLPFKILLFVLTGGWTLVVEFLIKGFAY